jgi:hypothetical protein
LAVTARAFTTASEAIDFSPSAVREMARLADPGTPMEILQQDLFTLPHKLDGTFLILIYFVVSTCNRT